MNNFDYTCRYCGNPGTFDNFDSYTDTYDAIKHKDIKDLSNLERSFAFAIRSIHVECFDNIVEEYKKSIHAGSYVSQVGFDDDLNRDSLFIHYIHKIDDEFCEVWSINTSTRYVRKGGEFIEKSKVSLESAISYMFVGMSNTATAQDLRNIFNEYVGQERRNFMMQIVESDTESMVKNDSLNAYETISILAEYHDFLEDVKTLENNLYQAEILTV